MSLTNTQYAAVMRMYDDIHTHNAAIQNERYKEVTSLCPQYQTIEDEIISLSMQEAAKRIGNDSSDTNTDEFNERLQSLIKQKAVLLASIGKPSDYLDNIYTCKKCQDTGYINGTRCSCFKKKAIDLIYHDSNLKNITANENFSTFSFACCGESAPLTGMTKQLLILQQDSHHTIIFTRYLMYASLL